MSSALFSIEMTARINNLLDKYFKQAMQEANEIDASYGYLWQNLRDITSGGGKRLRPHMVLLAYQAFGGTDPTRVLPAAIAHELLHISLLIHDDIIDRDYVRHGAPNIAGKYKEKYKEYFDKDEERTHFAHSAAILAGDLTLTAAFKVIVESKLRPKEKSIAQAMLAQSMFNVAGGELLDTEASFVPYTPGGALKTALYKTASYSFVSPLLTGARLAGISKAKEKHLIAYGESLGVAFQLVDDILGVFGDEQQTGKSTSSDLREGKRTYMVEQAFATMSIDEKILFDLGFGKQDASPEAIRQAKELIISSGGLAKSEALIQQHSATALEALGRLSLPKVWHEKFKTLITRTTHRAS